MDRVTAHKVTGMGANLIELLTRRLELVGIRHRARCHPRRRHPLRLHRDVDYRRGREGEKKKRGERGGGVQARDLSMYYCVW